MGGSCGARPPYCSGTPPCAAPKLGPRVAPARWRGLALRPRPPQERLGALGRAVCRSSHTPPPRVAVPSGGGGAPPRLRGGGGSLLWFPSWGGGAGGGVGGAASPAPPPRRASACHPLSPACPPGVYSCRGGCRAAAGAGRGLLRRQPVSAAGGGGVGLGWVKASPGRLPTVRAAFSAGPDWAAVPGCPDYRTTGLLTAPRPRGGARGREMPPCLCVCALVCLRGGGGGLWHTCLLHCCSALAHMARGSVCLVLQAPAGRLESLTLSPPGEMWAWARNLHVTRTCYPTTPRLPIGTGRRWYVARLGSDPHSLTALGTGGAASRAGSGSHGRGRTLGRWRGTKAQSVLPCPGCHQCWLHWLRRYSPRRRGGPEGTTPEWPLR